MPIDPPADWQPNSLRGKLAAGAQFVQTQFCMDVDIVRRYVGVLAKAGLTKDLAILIGINPLRSAKSAQWMRSHLFGTVIPDALIARMENAADPAREGIRICVDLIAELATIPGVAGVHIMAPGNDAAIPQVIAEARGRVQNATVQNLAGAAKTSLAGGPFDGVNAHLRCQRPVHRTLVGNLHEFRALLGVEIAFERDHPLDMIEQAFLGLALRAIGGVDAIVAKPYFNPLQRQLLLVGIKPQRH